MVNILKKQFEKEFPPFGPHSVPQVTDYMDVERLHIKMMEVALKHFEAKTRLELDLEEITELADKIFDDVGHRTYLWDDYGQEKIVIDFKNISIEEYIKKYSHHEIEIYKSANTPILTYNLANRGTASLHERQREKYFQFAIDLKSILMNK